MSVARIRCPRLPRHTTRGYSTTTDTVRDDLRNLLRHTAQPVAVVTSLMPEGSTSNSPLSKFHGATLSSFSSIAMDPHPLVAFSLRVPSRMATSLKNAHDHWPSHMVVNILSAAQVDIAVKFSRVDLHPHPFSEVPYFLTKEGLPVLEHSLGALSCKLVASSWPLHDLAALSEGSSKQEAVWDGEGVASELFIARVTRVEPILERSKDDISRTLPLLYHHRAYSTTGDIPKSNARKQ
ncbi:flavin reductase like domain-containing protein [Cristinia sonorae]|uniref:Flavin reductase like domain-containing protein n=1 Tax=Cristinia sonorae TaxID=1940300 RepID=A0A8K0UW87_9AGAR|nr:flavin reductase like domain-containing protein [Cristinia sonorae]